GRAWTRADVELALEGREVAAKTPVFAARPAETTPTHPRYAEGAAQVATLPRRAWRCADENGRRIWRVPGFDFAKPTAAPTRPSYRSGPRLNWDGSVSVPTSGRG